MKKCYQMNKGLYNELINVLLGAFIDRRLKQCRCVDTDLECETDRHRHPKTMIAFMKRSFILFNAIIKEIAKVSEENNIKRYQT